MTAGADITAAVAVFVRGGCCYRAAVARVCAYSYGIIKGVGTTYFYLAQFNVIKYPFKQSIGGGGVRVSVFLGACNDKPVCFCLLCKLAVVICAVTARVLDIENTIVVHMHHFVQ